MNNEIRISIEPSQGHLIDTIVEEDEDRILLTSSDDKDAETVNLMTSVNKIDEDDSI